MSAILCALCKMFIPIVGGVTINEGDNTTLANRRRVDSFSSAKKNSASVFSFSS